MTSKRNEILMNLAAEAGFDNVEEYILHCELTHTIKKVNRSLDRAFILDNLIVEPQEYVKEEKKGRKQKHGKRQIR